MSAALNQLFVDSFYGNFFQSTDIKNLYKNPCINPLVFQEFWKIGEPPAAIGGFVVQVWQLILGFLPLLGIAFMPPLAQGVMRPGIWEESLPHEETRSGALRPGAWEFGLASEGRLAEKRETLLYWAENGPVPAVPENLTSVSYQGEDLSVEQVVLYALTAQAQADAATLRSLYFYEQGVHFTRSLGSGDFRDAVFVAPPSLVHLNNQPGRSPTVLLDPAVKQTPFFRQAFKLAAISQLMFERQIAETVEPAQWRESYEAIMIISELVKWHTLYTLARAKAGRAHEDISRLVHINKEPWMEGILTQDEQSFLAQRLNEVLLLRWTGPWKNKVARLFLVNIQRKQSSLGSTADLLETAQAQLNFDDGAARLNEMRQAGDTLAYKKALQMGAGECGVFLLGRSQYTLSSQ